MSARRTPRAVARRGARPGGVAFLVALFQPFAGDGRRRGAGRRSRRTRASGDRRHARQAGGGRERHPVRVARAAVRRRRRPQAGGLHLRKDMPYGDVLDTLEHGPGPATLIQLTIPGGLSRREIAPLAGRAGVRGNYLAATRQRRSGCPAEFRGERICRPRGVHVPGHLRAAPGRRAPRAGAEAGRRVRAELRARSTSPMRSRKNLTPYDVLKIASMVEREAKLDRERPLVAAVIYNRLKRASRSASTPRSATRPATGPQPLKQSELAQRLRPTTRARARACRRRRSATRVSRRSRPRRARRSVGYLYYVVKPGTCGEHAFSTTFAAVPAGPGALQRGPRRRRRQIAHDMSVGTRRHRHRDMPTVRTGVRSLAGLAGRAQPLAGDAERRLRGARPRLALRAACRSSPSVSTEFVRGHARRGFAGANVTIPHKLAALAIADSATDVARASGAANTLHFHGRADRGRQHRRGGPSRRARPSEPRARRGACAAWCWRRRRRAGRRLRAPARRTRPPSRSGTAHPERAGELVQRFRPKPLQETSGTAEQTRCIEPST